VIVADDSKEINTKYYVQEHKYLKYIKLSFDTGLAEGRNILAQHVTTKCIQIRNIEDNNYDMLLLDDDFVITDETFMLEYFVDILENTDVKIVGGNVEGEASSFNLEMKNNSLIVKTCIQDYIEDPVEKL
jgi:hypothetical protein